MMKTAKAVYESVEKSILDMFKAADIYALHLLSKFRNSPPPTNDTIESIVNGSSSLLRLTGALYTKAERQLLEKDGHLRSIGQQILVASYTAVELYLINKFQEFFRNTLAGVPDAFVEASIEQLSFRSLKDISKLYFNFYNIHLPSFDIKFHTVEESNFRPNTAWQALQLLSTARNEIVHRGESVATGSTCWWILGIRLSLHAIMSSCLTLILIILFTEKRCRV